MGRGERSTTTTTTGSFHSYFAQPSSSSYSATSRRKELPHRTNATIDKMMFHASAACNNADKEEEGKTQDMDDTDLGKNEPLKLPPVSATPPMGKRPGAAHTGNDPDGSFEKEEKSPMRPASCRTPGQARKRTRLEAPDSTGVNSQMNRLGIYSANKEEKRKERSNKGKGRNITPAAPPNFNPFLETPRKNKKNPQKVAADISDSRYLRTFDEKATLGSGSFCSVYMCRHRLDGCMYAVKRSLNPLSQNSAKRKAMKEVFALAAMADCEYIARYFNVWGEDEQLYIQLELGYGSLEAALMGKRPTKKVSYYDIAQTWKRRGLPVPLWFRILAKRCGVDIGDDTSEVERLLQQSKFTPGSAESVVSEEFSSGRDSGQNLPPEIYRPKAKTKPRYDRRESYDDFSYRSQTASLPSQDSPNADHFSLDSESQTADQGVIQTLRFSSPTPTANEESQASADAIGLNLESQISAANNKDEGGRNYKQTRLPFAFGSSSKKREHTKPSKTQSFSEVFPSGKSQMESLYSPTYGMPQKLSQSEAFQLPPSQEYFDTTSPSIERVDDDEANDAFCSETRNGDESNHSDTQMMSQASMCSLEALSQHYDPTEDPFGHFDLSYRPRLPCSEWDLRRITHDIAAALAFMHARGMVHLDVKPANILVNYGSGPGMCDKNGDWLPSVNLMTGLVSLDNDLAEDADPKKIPKMPVRYKLADLGQATRLDDPNFEEGDSRYTSKELMQGHAEDIASCDMFALGLMMYELASGVPLPKGGDEYHRLRDGKIRELPQCSQVMQNLVLQLISPDPQQRPRATEVLTHPLISTASPFQAYARHSRNNRTGSENDATFDTGYFDPYSRSTLGNSAIESPDPLRQSKCSDYRTTTNASPNTSAMTVNQLDTSPPSSDPLNTTVASLKRQIEKYQETQDRLLQQIKDAGMTPYL